MAWPTPQDFREAVQNPRLAFGDGELQSGSPELDRLGLPRPWSGAFATVYRMRCGGRSWAVRCFLHPLSDEQERYAAISGTLASLQLPSLVGCRFVAEGIRVGSRRYPILKMEWVEGESFNHYIERHLRQPALLLDLAGRWIRLVEQLRQVSLAHGDLQHGNILIAGGEFRLVDYDGMYVPSLAGKSSRELGHRNFQHPRRSAQDFGPWLDHFSAWAIYVSLLALAVDPGLWQRFRGGDECLLFRADDFRRPEQSALYRSLERSPDRRLRSAVTLFKSLLYLPPSQIPPLSNEILSASPAAAPPPALGGWITDHVSATPKTKRPAWMEAPAPAGVTRAAASQSWPEWMRDFAHAHDAEPGRAGFRASVFPERLGLLGGLAAGAAVWLSPGAWPVISSAGADAGIAAALLLWLLARYRREPARLQRIRLSQDEIQAQARVRETEAALHACQQRREACQQQEEADDENLEIAERQLRDRQREEEDQIRLRLGKALVDLNLQRQQLRQEESAAMQRLVAEAAQRMASWRRADTTGEEEELQLALRSRQEEYRLACLRGQAIQEECVPGLGRGQLRRLRAAGLTSAADLEEKALASTGIDRPCLQRLLAWRKGLELRASVGMPHALTPAEIAQVQQQRESRRRLQELQQQREGQRQKDEKDRLEARICQMRAALDEQESRLKQAAEQESRGMQQRIHQRIADLKSERQARRQERATHMAELDREAEALGRTTFGLYWRMDDLQRQQAACRSIRFGGYLLRILGLSRR